MLNPVGRRRRASTDACPPYAGKFVKDADPALIDELAAPRPARDASSTTRTRTRTAGAAARRSSTGPSPRGSRARPRTRTSCCARTRRSAGTPSTSSTAASATGSRTTSTGRSRATASGARRSRSGAATTAGTTRASARSPSSRELAGRDLADLDLHRPYVDDVAIACPKCERPRRARVEPVLDAWFDSGVDAGGAVPLPVRERRTLFERRFPADFICEAIDQTRGWFYSLLAVNTLVFGRTPYRNVVCLALLVDQDGQKMSKSTRQRHRPVDGARHARRRRAAVELLLVGSPWTPQARVDREASTSRRSGSSSRSGTRTRSSSPTRTSTAGTPGSRPRARRRRTCSTAGSARACTRTVARGHRRARGLRRAARRAGARRASSTTSRTGTCAGPARGSGSRPTRDARTRRCTSACSRVALLLAPFCPFVADELYRNLADADESVHLADWPAYDARRVDATLEAEMDAARASWCRSGCRRATRRSSGCASRSPRARAAARRRAVRRRGRARDRRRAEREGSSRRVTEPRRPARLLGRPELPGARPAVGKPMPLREGRAASPPTARTVQRALDDRRHVRPRARRRHDRHARARRRRGARPSHTRSSRSREDGGYAVALDTTLDDDLRVPRAWPATSSARSTISARRSTSTSPTGSVSASPPTGRVEAAAHRHRDWIAREVLAVEFEVHPGTVDIADRIGARAGVGEVDGEPVGLAIVRVERRRRKRPRRSRPGRRRRTSSARHAGPSGTSSRTASRSDAKKASSSRSSPPSTAFASTRRLGDERLVLGGEVVPRRRRVARGNVARRIDVGEPRTRLGRGRDIFVTRRCETVADVAPAEALRPETSRPTTLRPRTLRTRRTRLTTGRRAAATGFRSDAARRRTTTARARESGSGSGTGSGSNVRAGGAGSGLGCALVCARRAGRAGSRPRAPRACRRRLDRRRTHAPRSASTAARTRSR